jgi:glycosyltransferase involved in cell wall biosynthesis
LTCSDKPLNILHLLLSLNECSAPYNEHCLAAPNIYNLTICTYFKPHLFPPKKCILFAGDGSLKGLFRALKAALNARDYDIIHAHASHIGILLPVAKFLNNSRFLDSTVYTFHSSYPNYKFRNKLMLIPIFALFQKIICCGQASFQSLPPFLKSLAGARLYTIQNGVAIDRIDRVIGSNRRWHKRNGFTVTTVGRLIETKNPISVLRAFQESSGQTSNLVFVGDGNLRNSLSSEIRRLDLEKQVTVTGVVRREDVYTYLAGTNLFISASIVEGLPVAVLEAMACRCPVILSDIPSHREIASGTDFIPLLQPDDVAGFAEEIRKFKGMSASERQLIGEKCRKIAEERFSLNTMHCKYQEVYNELSRK